MEVMKLINHINLATDEDFEILEVIQFINDGIARINVEVSANFPFIEDDLPNESMYQFEEYDAFSDSWQRQLLIPYAAGRIKENDSSQFEYTDWYNQFERNLKQFKEKFVIPERYKDTSVNDGRFEEDYSTNMFTANKMGW